MLPAYATDPDAVLNDPTGNIQWRSHIPNYAKAHTFFNQYKTTDHKAGSLEAIVQNLVKNWEKEVSHKVDPRQWETVDLDNYYFSCNGLQKYTGWEMLKKGTYNALIGDSMYYTGSTISFEDSHKVFRESLGNGFAWEVTEVFSGPPNVTFTWRHFGTMTGHLSCPGMSGVTYKAEATNKMIEIFGMCKATVNDQLKIQDLQVFYDPNQLFIQMTASCPFSSFFKDDSAAQPLAAAAAPPLSAPFAATGSTPALPLPKDTKVKPGTGHQASPAQKKPSPAQKKA